MNLFTLSTGRTGTLSVARTFGFTHEPPEGRCSLEDITRRADAPFHGEIGHHLLEHMFELKEIYSNALFIHLVRDGRLVVKSFQRLKERLPHTFYGMTGKNEFERLCKMWGKANKDIEGITKLRIRLEDLAPFITRVIPRAGFSKRHEEIPWTEEETELFEKYCGELNRKYGYT